MGKSMNDNKLGLIRKDLPFKSTMTVFECKLNYPEMDKQIKKVIDKSGDKQNHKTNVKAQMTNWKMWDEPGFNQLANLTLEISKKISIEKYNRVVVPVLGNLWGMKYKSEEVAIAHDHWPSIWSFAYYLNAPKGAPGLFFPEMGEQGGERKIEPGLLIFFEGHIKHAVRKNKFKGYRYVVSGNIKEKYSYNLKEGFDNNV